MQENTTKIIGVCVADISTDYNDRFFEAFKRLAHEFHFKVLFFSAFSPLYWDQKHDIGEGNIYQLIDTDVLDGLIMLTITIKNELVRESIIEHAKKRDIPVISIEYPLEGSLSIIYEYKSTIRKLLSHLIDDHGYRRINFIAGPKDNLFSEERLQVYRDVLTEHQIPVEEARIGYGDFWYGPTHTVVQSFIDSDLPMPEAIVCANDSMAIAAIQYLTDHGYNVPEDVAVTGFDDWERIRHVPVPITTIRQDSERSGYMAVYSALELARSGQGKNIVIPAKVCVRESCGCTCKQFSGFDQIENMGQKFVYEKQKNTVYRQKTWMVPMISRNMLIALQDREKFLKNALTPMSFFGVKTALLYVFRNPVEYNIEKGWEFPNTIYLVARQDGECVEVFDEYKNVASLEECGFSEEGSVRYQRKPSVFCLQSGSTQYGVLSVEITPEEVDMVYLISIQMANALMAYHTEKKRLSVQRERELLLEELRSKNEILNFVSERDELTQIKNRRGFMEQAMEMNRVYKNRKAIILFADMDGLKQINDNYGHAAGDIAICACADILKKAAGVHGIAGRLGGDEFALMMIGDETRAIELVETVRKEIAMYNAQGKNKFAIDMSVGCQIVLCTDELSIPMVLEKADKIMYEEKKKKGKAR